MTLVVTSGVRRSIRGPSSGFTAKVDILSKLTASSVAAGATIPFTFAVTVPTTAGNTYAGLQVSTTVDLGLQHDA